jgi:hypothetical protein
VSQFNLKDLRLAYAYCVIMERRYEKCPSGNIKTVLDDVTEKSTSIE